MDTYNLRTRTQARAQRLEEHTEIGEPTQTVPTTTSEESRGTDRQTDIQTAHQTEYNTLPTAPHLYVGSHQSGTTTHALETQSATSSQLSEDPTVDSIVQELFAEDSELAVTDLDTSSRGLGEERPVFPGLTLPVAGTTLSGAEQGLATQEPSLELHTEAGSCPQSVDPAHPDAHAGTCGACHSTHFWGESESLLEQKQHSDQSTTTANTRPSTPYTDPATSSLPRTPSKDLYFDPATSPPRQTSSACLHIDLTSPSPHQLRQQLPHLDAASTAQYQTPQQHRYIDDPPPINATNSEEMCSAAACAMPDDFLYCNSVLGPSDKENYSVGSLSQQSDEGHASYMSDSPPVCDIDMVQTQMHTKTMIFTQSETLSTPTDTEKTILASNTTHDNNNQKRVTNTVRTGQT